MQSPVLVALVLAAAGLGVAIVASSRRIRIIGGVAIVAGLVTLVVTRPSLAPLDEARRQEHFTCEFLAQAFDMLAALHGAKDAYTPLVERQAEFEGLAHALSPVEGICLAPKSPCLSLDGPPPTVDVLVQRAHLISAALRTRGDCAGSDVAK